MNILHNLNTLAPYQRNRIILGVAVAVFIIIIIVGIVMSLSGNENSISVSNENVTITFWDVFDSEEVYRELIQEYRRQNPNVTIEYIHKPQFDAYRNTVTEALAEGEGPDLYVIHNSWLPLECKRLIPYNEVSDFPDVVRFDFTREDVKGEPLVYALPVSIDTLALYYNVDYFNSANILNPPQTWEKFVEDIKTLLYFYRSC